MYAWLAIKIRLTAIQESVWDLHSRRWKEQVLRREWRVGCGRTRSHPLSSARGQFLVGHIAGRLVVMVPSTCWNQCRRDQANACRAIDAAPRVGARMLSELEAHAAAKGYRMAKLDTTRQQVAAQALYIAAGYTVVGSGRVGSFETVLFQKPLP